MKFKWDAWYRYPYPNIQIYCYRKFIIFRNNSGNFSANRNELSDRTTDFKYGAR